MRRAPDRVGWALVIALSLLAGGAARGGSQGASGLSSLPRYCRPAFSLASLIFFMISGWRTHSTLFSSG
jgi:hypothetical protein